MQSPSEYHDINRVLQSNNSLTKLQKDKSHNKIENSMVGVGILNHKKNIPNSSHLKNSSVCKSYFIILI